MLRIAMRHEAGIYLHFPRVQSPSRLVRLAERQTMSCRHRWPFVTNQYLSSLQPIRRSPSNPHPSLVTRLPPHGSIHGFMGAAIRSSCLFFLVFHFLPQCLGTNPFGWVGTQHIHTMPANTSTIPTTLLLWPSQAPLRPLWQVGAQSKCDRRRRRVSRCL